MESIADRLNRIFGSNEPVAFVTGSAAKRVGRTIAEHFADRGYRIVVHANRSVDQGEQFVRELKSAGTEAMMVSGPVEDEASAASWCEQILDKFGSLDVLVNSAAIWDPKPFDQVTADDLKRYFEINTVGSFLCAQQAGLKMVQQSTGGAIIQLGDWAVARPYLNYSAYFPSKGGAEVMVRSLAVELASRNPRIRVSGVMPGPVTLPADLPDGLRSKLINESLVRREGSPRDIAEAVVFLAESEFITGVCLPVDGGRTIYSGDTADGLSHPGWKEMVDQASD